MSLLILGLLIFFGVHALSTTGLRAILIAKLGRVSPGTASQAGLETGSEADLKTGLETVKKSGEKRYKLAYSVLSLIGFGLIIYGKSQAEFIAVWQPPYWTRYCAMGIMPFALLCLALPDIPNNFLRFIRHPMMTGILLWAIAHLTANGDLASVLLFASFGLYGAYTVMTGKFYKPYQSPEPVAWYYDVFIVLLVLIAGGVIAKFHYFLSGVPLF